MTEALPEREVAHKRDRTTWGKWRQANFDFYSEALRHEDRRKILLDLGAGPIQFFELFSQFQYIGADFQPFSGVALVADLTKGIPRESASVDIITASNFFEHIPNPDFVMRECFRILKPGGVFLGTVPFLFNIHQEPHDYWRYTNFILEHLFRASGFSSVEIRVLNNVWDSFSVLKDVFFRELWKTHRSRAISLVWRVINLHFALLRILCGGAMPVSVLFHLGYGFKAVKK